MWCFGRFGTIYRIWKTQKIPVEECYTTLFKVTPLHVCFSRFSNCRNGTESLKASQINVCIKICTLCPAPARSTRNLKRSLWCKIVKTHIPFSFLRTCLNGNRKILKIFQLLKPTFCFKGNFFSGKTTKYWF